MTPLSIWTIYDWSPRRGWIASRWDLDGGTLRLGWETVQARDLESLRAILHGYGLLPLPSNITDDPQVVECWI